MTVRAKYIAVGLAGGALIALSAGAAWVVADQRSVRDTPLDVASPAGPGSAEPNLAVSPAGDVYMTWLEPLDSAFALKFAVWDGHGWSEARTIRTSSDFFVNWADFPSLELLGNGTLAAHWLQRTGAGTYAYGVRIALSEDEGMKWSAPIRPHTDTSNTEHGFVSLWRDGNGLSAVWLDGRKYDKAGHHPSNEMALATVSLNTSGEFSSAERILDDRVCDCCQTSAAVTDKGPVIVYRDRSPNEIRDVYIIRRVEETPGMLRRWTQPAPVHNDGWKIAACPVNGPAVDADGEKIAVAWFTAANDSPRVHLAFSRNAGETFDSPIRVDNGRPAGRVDVELLSDGGALVSWIERTGGDTAAVLLRRVQKNGQPGAPVTVAASSAARASGFPRMAIRGNEALFAWTVPGRPSTIRVVRLPIAAVR